MKRVYWHLIRILKVSLKGLLRQQEKKYIVRQSELSSECYENRRVIYKARPLTDSTYIDEKAS